MGSVFIELDPTKERLRQREGWYHWVVASQEGVGGAGGGDSSVSSPTYPPMAMTGAMGGGGGGMGDRGAPPPEYSIIGRPGESPLTSAAPSEASDSIIVSLLSKLNNWNPRNEVAPSLIREGSFYAQIIEIPCD